MANAAAAGSVRCTQAPCRSIWIPAFAGMHGVWGDLSLTHTVQ